VQVVRISHDSKYLVIGGKDGLIEVWSYPLLALDVTLPYQAQNLFMLHRQSILSLVFSNDDKLLASGDAEGIVRIWKFADGKKLREIDTQGGSKCGVSTMVFTSNNA
jgi:WD40 repeat protein